MEYDDRVMCPLIDEKIDPMECVDVVDCVLNPLLLNSLPESIKQKKILKIYANNANGTVIEENTIVGMQYDFIYLVVTIKYM